MIEWKDMLVYGGKVSAEWQSQAWAIVVDNQDPWDLEGALLRTGPQFGRDAAVDAEMSSYQYVQEIANRMRQKARKAGLIEMTGKPKRWRFK